MDWPVTAVAIRLRRYSALDQINTANVKTLGVAWAFQTGDYGDSLQSTPLVIDGVMYVSTSYAQVFPTQRSDWPDESGAIISVVGSVGHRVARRFVSIAGWR